MAVRIALAMTKLQIMGGHQRGQMEQEVMNHIGIPILVDSDGRRGMRRIYGHNSRRDSGGPENLAQWFGDVNEFPSLMRTHG